MVLKWNSTNGLYQIWYSLILMKLDKLIEPIYKQKFGYINCMWNNIVVDFR